MTGAGRAPGPVLALGAATLVIAFLADAPAVLVAVLAGSAALWAVAPRRSRVAPAVAAASAAGMVVLTPLVGANGDLILLDGPRIPLLDTEVTLEELVGGALSGIRIAAVILLSAAVLGAVDPDRLQALAGRLAPRSALVCGLAARLAPSLQRDARSITEAARLRGAPLAAGGHLARARAAGPLLVPLLGSSLERALDSAEAMAARAYGSGRRTRRPEPPAPRSDRVLVALAAAVAVTGAAALVTGALAFDPYPRLPPLATPAAVLAGVVLTVLLGAAALVVRR